MYPVDLIFKVVPQRYPFLMIDRIQSHEHRKRAVCLKNITLGEEVLSGHFPGNPVYPGVLLIEMGLQATQVMLSDLDAVQAAQAGEGGPSPEQGYVLQIEKFKFVTAVRPGDVVEITSTLEQEAMGMVKARIMLTLAGDPSALLAQGLVTVGSRA